jgi:dGTPase
MHDQMAVFASCPEHSRGRVFAEEASASRSVFQRDRDRIIHSTAFRRLKHKTQVFAAPEGDHYRTRLTHSLEVAQIARSAARALGLDEDLTEALALAHDLGHPPFGHAGERALCSCMKEYGGFDHNVQSLKLVTSLERRYGDFDGLNLTWETLEGLVKHNGPLEKGKIHPLINLLDKKIDLLIHLHGSAESQVAALADDIAYNAHDIDDGIRAGLLSLEQIESLPLAGDAMQEVRGRWKELEPVRLVHETIRRLITFMVNDLLGESRTRLAQCGASSADDIRRCGRPVIAFSKPVGAAIRDLNGFLLTNMYRHEKVMTAMDKAERIIKELFEHYMYRPRDLPHEWRLGTGSGLNRELALQVCDFIAGMTDNFAIRTHKTLFDAAPDIG